MNDERLDALIDLHLSGAMSEEERRELEARLLHSAVDRARFWELAETHALLHEGIQQGLAEAAPRRHARRLPWLQWRPLAAAAAGLIIGCFSVSVLWAYSVNQRSVILFHEGFEASPKIVRQNFPDRMGEWSVVGAAVVGAEGEVAPKEGQHMLRLNSKLREKSTRAFYVVDLRASPRPASGSKQQFDFRAAFHPAVLGKTDRYILRAAAFADELPEVDLRWMRELWGEVEDHSLASAARVLTVAPGTAEWKTLSLTIDVPPGARILVLSVWTATMEENQDDRGAHYVDDIRLLWLTNQSGS